MNLKNFLVITTFVWFPGFARASGVSQAPRIGEPAPSLKVDSLWNAPPGASTTPQALKDQVVVVEFWATWCAPCVAAFHHLNDLVDQFQGKPVRFLSITDESPAVVKRFLKKHPLKTWVGSDTDRSLFKAYHADPIPRTVLIDRKGRLAALASPGDLTKDLLEDLIAGRPISVDDPYAQSQETGSDNLGGAKPLFQIVVTPAGADPNQYISFSVGLGHYHITGFTLLGLIAAAHGFDRAQIECTMCDQTRYTFTLSIPKEQQPRQKQLFRTALETAFGLRTRIERRPIPVYVLKRRKGYEPNLPEGEDDAPHSSSQAGIIIGLSSDMNGLTQSLRLTLDRPVVNETGLTGKYDWDIQYEKGNQASLIQVVREQLKLDLVQATRSIPFLVVESDGGKEVK